jgi:flagellar protein FlbD
MPMIKLTRFHGKSFYLNDDLIETVESTPDTTIQLTTGKRVLVQETADQVLERIVEYRRRLFLTDPNDAGLPASGTTGGAR